VALRALVRTLDRPIAELDLPVSNIALLERAGVRTLGDLVSLTNDRLRRLGVDRPTRDHIAGWRREVGRE
jgi:DNA-directed RNA polymerase alpha subunit